MGKMLSPWVIAVESIASFDTQEALCYHLYGFNVWIEAVSL